jgi:hypothetical protein
VVLRFSMSVVTWRVRRLTVKYVHRYRVRYWLNESGCPMSKGKFLIGLIHSSRFLSLRRISRS